MIGYSIANFLGDSITEGMGVTDILENRYDNILVHKYGLKKANNFGISGTRLARQKYPDVNNSFDYDFCQRVDKMPLDADLIVVFGGTNDYGHGDAPLGIKEDKTPQSFYGAVDYLMTKLKTLYPGSQILFLTPLHREGDEFPSTESNREEKHPLVDFVNAILYKGKEHGIPVLDLYHDFECDFNIKSDKQMYSVDGLHLNSAGHQLLAEKIDIFLNELNESNV